MATESPLFQSSMELFGHSIEHFNGNSELDRKMVILHLANAVELLLKDLLLDQGSSIYKNPKETITIHAAVSMLGECKISLPGFNKMEMLIDERNALQHRYGSPNELTTVYYMEATTEFFRSMLSEHYDLKLDEVLPQFVEAMELEAFRSRQPSDEGELENLKRLARLHPVGAFLSASRYLEHLIASFFEELGDRDVYRRRPPWAFLSPRILQAYGIELPDDLEARLFELRSKRNMVAHGRIEPTEKDVVEAVDIIERLERSLADADRGAVADKIRLEREDMEQRRRLVRSMPPPPLDTDGPQRAHQTTSAEGTSE